MITERPAPPAKASAVPLAVLSLAAGLDAGGVAVINSALPAIGREWSASAQSLSWAVTGYALAFAGLLLGGGALADRFPRRRVLVAGLLVLAAGAVMALAAPAFWAVAAGRVVQGAGAAITLPAATALVTDVYPAGPARERALGVFSSAQAAAYGAGLVLGGVLTSSTGWRWVFGVQAAIALAAVAASWLVPSVRTERPERVDVLGAVSLTASIALLILGADLTMHASAMGTPALAAAAGFAVLWWWRGRAGRPALLDRALLRLRSVRLAAAGAVAFYFCVTGSLFFVPLYLQDVRGMTAAASGLAVLPVSIAVAGTAVLTGRLLPRFGLRTVLTAGLLLTGGGVALWCLTSEHSSYRWPILAGLVVTGIGQGLAFPALTAAGLRDVPDSARATASAVTSTALQVGSGIGPAALVAIGDGSTALSLGGYHAAFAVAATVVAAFAAIAARTV
ncbi:MFS transporter [Actinomadura roseirufa]|uniref:MFS transporter n=1 Tax=Actinomadura roseirufa TaxID=2094049 RepID=UPI001041BC7A|nr:MFS transporter [Actinomadura roseirufa]